MARGRRARRRSCRRRQRQGKRPGGRSAPRLTASRPNSARQGPHHEPQRFTTTGYPRSARIRALSALMPPSSLSDWACSAASAGGEPASSFLTMREWSSPTWCRAPPLTCLTSEAGRRPAAGRDVLVPERDVRCVIRARSMARPGRRSRRRAAALRRSRPDRRAGRAAAPAAAAARTECGSTRALVDGGQLRQLAGRWPAAA